MRIFRLKAEFWSMSSVVHSQQGRPSSPSISPPSCWGQNPKIHPGGLDLAKTLRKGLFGFFSPGKTRDLRGARPRVESGHAFQGSDNWERAWNPRPRGLFTPSCQSFHPAAAPTKIPAFGKAGEEEDELFMCSAAP